MATIGISEAFAKYGARLKNVNWSVSAWNAAGELVLSLWAHHYRKGEDGSAEYFGKLSRWAGPGNSESRANISSPHGEIRSNNGCGPCSLESNSCRCQVIRMLNQNG